MDRGLTAVLGFFSFWLGASIASFLNVVIWRVPRGESIVSPPSHCPKCRAPIRWWQNVPILSWLALRGTCANCRAPISPRYVCVELLGGLLFLAAFLKHNPLEPFFWSPTVVALLVAWVWISLMIVGSFIDFDHQLLPDFVTVGGMILGVVWAAARAVWVFRGCGWGGAVFRPLVFSVVGLAFGFGLLWLVRAVGSKVFGREAMGMGDVFLMGAVGALFGPGAVLVTLVLSSVFGSVVGVAMILLAKTKLGRFTAIPYGPYICLGCLAFMFCGREIERWYLNLFAP
ncbi:MAG: prepilin peptidase [Kiritimatiellae bacterium]|nr:prepilin peptidase [Kiritimatiellia bacterium]